MKNFEIFDITCSPALMIECEGNEFSCFDTEDYMGLCVPKLSDILCQTDSFKKRLFKYIRERYSVGGEKENPFDFYYGAQQDGLFKFINENQDIFVKRELTAEEKASIAPLIKIMHNFYNRFNNDYQEQSKLTSGKLQIVVDRQWYQLDKELVSSSALFLSKKGDSVRACLGFGSFGEKIIVKSNSMYGCLKEISDCITKLSSGQLIANDENHHIIDQTDEKDFKTLSMLCKIGTSDKLSQFREAKFGSSEEIFKI